MRIFKTRVLARFTKRERIPDASLSAAVDQVERGLIDADLGGFIIKQRVARAGQGKSGGYRMLIGFRSKHRAVFMFGFAKNDLDNIDDKQLASLRETAALWLMASAAKIEKAKNDGILIEVPHDDDKK